MKKLKMFLGLVGMISILAMSISCNNGVNPEDNSGKSEPGVASQTGSIKGKVLYSNSNDSSDILVCVEKTNGGVAQSVRELARSAVARSSFITKKASKDGTYSFDDLEPGTYTVYASSDYSKEKAVTTDVVVKANNTATAADLKLTATGSISGKVILDGTSTDNAGFIVCVSGTSYLAVTADDGSYTIYDIPAGQEYSLSVIFGTFVASKKATAKVEAKNTAKAADIKISTNEIKANMLNGDSNGSVIYTFDIIDEAGTKSDLPYNVYGDNYQREYDFVNYTNKRMVKSGDTVNVKACITSDVDISSLNCIIVDNKDSKWRVLTSEEKYVVAKNIKAGKAFDIDLSAEILADQIEQLWIVIQTDDLAACSRAPNLTFTRVTESTDTYYGVKAPTNKYVSVTATDRGIKFNGTILSNISNYSANATIEITEIASGVSMIQNWTKTTSSWENWNLIYPFVEKGKSYNFNVRVYVTNWTMYEEYVSITATGGLGEYKVENVSELKAELTEDRVIKRIGTPEFTKNDKVKVISKGTNYDFYRDKLWDFWIYNTVMWDDDDDGEFPLKDIYRISGWRKYEYVEDVMSGHNYGLQICTYIKVAGYTYNDTAYFVMNDAIQDYGAWGGDRIKAYVLFVPSLPYSKDKPEILDLPGEKIKIKEVYKKEVNGKIETEESESVVNAIIVDYGDSIAEPAYVPYCSTTKSKFNGWTQNHSDNKVTFPYTPGKKVISSNDLDSKYYVDGKQVVFLDEIGVDVSLFYTATLMDGDEVIGTEEFEVEADKDFAPMSLSTAVANKEGYVSIGWFEDKECKNPAYKKYGDTTVYAGWIKVENVWNGSNISYSNISLDDLFVGDTLYFVLQNTNSSNYNSNLYLRDGNYSYSKYIDYRLKPNETKTISYTFTSNNDSYLIKYIKNYGLYVSTNYSSIYLKGIYRVKAPRPETCEVYYTAQYGEVDYEVKDDWKSLELVFDENTNTDNFTIKLLSDKSIPDDYNTGIVYLSALNNNTIVFADELSRNSLDEDDQEIPNTSLAAQGATKITKVGIVYKGNSSSILKILGAKAVKADGTKEAVIPTVANNGWGCEISY